MRFDPFVKYVWDDQNPRYDSQIHEKWRGTTARYIKHVSIVVEMEFTFNGATSVSIFTEDCWIPAELEVDPLKELFIDV